MSVPRTIQIQGQDFHLSDPSPRNNHAESLVGLEKPERLTQAILLTEDDRGAPVNAILEGDPGVGKTSLVEKIAAARGQQLFCQSCTEDLYPSELSVIVRPDADGKLVHTLSPLATAMVLGQLALLDEVEKVKPRTSAALCPLLDHRRSLYSDLAGLTIRCKPGFRVLATSNREGGHVLPEWLAQRFTRVRVPNPTSDQLCEIVRRRFPEDRERVNDFLDLFFDTWRKADPTSLPAPRTLVQTASLAFRLAEYDEGDMTVAHVEDAIHATRY